MTFEERMDSLTAKHEAMATNLEIMSGMIKDMIAREEERDRKLAERDLKIDERFERILTILEAHQARLDRIEGGQ